jgi:hypothetical protein
MTNVMNAIANQVIPNSGRSVRNAGWPYFDGTFRDYQAFKRKFESFKGQLPPWHAEAGAVPAVP